MRQATCLRWRNARQPLATSCSSPWATKVAETGSTRARAPFSSRPPAMPKTPEMAAVTKADAMMKAPIKGVIVVLRSCDRLRKTVTGRLRSPVSCASRAGPNGRCKPVEASAGDGPPLCTGRVGLGRRGVIRAAEEECRFHGGSAFAYTEAGRIATLARPRPSASSPPVSAANGEGEGREKPAGRLDYRGAASRTHRPSTPTE